MQTDKMKVLLYLKKSGLDRSRLAPIMGRITYGRTIAQFSCKLSCDPKLWNARESRLNGKSREAVATNGKLERLLLSAQSAYQTLCERGVVFTATDIKDLASDSGADTRPLHEGAEQRGLQDIPRYNERLEATQSSQSRGVGVWHSYSVDLALCKTYVRDANARGWCAYREHR